MDFLYSQFASGSTSAETKLWNFIYDLSIQLKIRMFIWRAISDILPMGKNLMKLGLYESMNYIHNGYSIDDDRHALFDCRFSKTD